MPLLICLFPFVSCPCMLEYYLNTLIKLDQHQGVKFQSTVDKNVLQVSREKKRKSDI
jgi:hypothetical protein